MPRYTFERSIAFAAAASLSVQPVAAAADTNLSAGEEGDGIVDPIERIDPNAGLPATQEALSDEPGATPTATQDLQALRQRTDYIKGLDYDLRRTLSVSLQDSSLPKSVDPFTRYQKRSATVICKKEEVEAGKGIYRTENALLNPGSGVVYPGALVRLDETLAEGMPTPIPLRRAPLRIKIDLPGLGSKGSVLVQNPTNVTVGNAVENIIETWFMEAQAAHDYQPAIRAFADSQKAYTDDQISVEMGFGAQWGENWATSNLEVESNSDNTTIVRTFKQIYYTVNIEEPSEAGAVFANDVVLDRSTVDASGPPGIVRSVDYGRFIIVVLNTNNSVKSVDARATMDFVTGTGANLDAEATAKYEKILNNSRVSILALGGNAGDSVDLFTGDMNSPEAFSSIIRKGLAFDRRNPGFPVSYITADLKSRQTAKMNTTTKYIMTECEEFPAGYVDVKMDGAYVGRFQVGWQEFDDAGQLVPKSWDSKSKTAGYKHRINLPGDAQNIRVKGLDYTGLVWEPKRTVMDRILPAVTNKCYRISGTTLNPREEVRNSC